MTKYNENSTPAIMHCKFGIPDVSDDYKVSPHGPDDPDRDCFWVDTLDEAIEECDDIVRIRKEAEHAIAAKLGEKLNEQREVLRERKRDEASRNRRAADALQRDLDKLAAQATVEEIAPMLDGLTPYWQRKVIDGIVRGAMKRGPILPSDVLNMVSKETRRLAEGERRVNGSLVALWEEVNTLTIKAEETANEAEGN